MVEETKQELERKGGGAKGTRWLAEVWKGEINAGVLAAGEVVMDLNNTPLAAWGSGTVWGMIHFCSKLSDCTVLDWGHPFPSGCSRNHARMVWGPHIGLPKIRGNVSHDFPEFPSQPADSRIPELLHKNNRNKNTQLFQAFIPICFLPAPVPVFFFKCCICNFFPNRPL